MTRMIAAAVAVIGLAGAASAQTPHGPIHGVAAGGCGSCAAESAGAGWGGPAVGWGGGGCKECDPKFGVNPIFKRLLFWRRASTCSTCGRLLGGGRGRNCAGTPGGAGGYGAGGYGAGGGAGFNPYPEGVPGTLVYPYNPYIRSPRDWFMNDK